MQQIASGRFDVPRSECQACQSCQQCSTGFAAAHSLPSEWLPAGTVNGQKVGISFSARSLLRAALSLFGLPLMVFLSATLWSEYSGYSEPMIAVSGLLGLILGLAAGTFLLPGNQALSSQVKVIKLLNNTTATLS